MSNFSFSQCDSKLFLSTSFWKRDRGIATTSRKLSLLPEEKLQGNYRLVHSFYVSPAPGMSVPLHSSLPPAHSSLRVLSPPRLLMDITDLPP